MEGHRIGRSYRMDNRSTAINMIDTSILIDGCDNLGITLSDRQLEQFVRYYQLLCEKNQVMNLTSVTEWNEVQTKHYLDSLLLCKAVDLTKKHRVLDLGTGAGFPGIPLKIAYPDLEIVLADSLNKRIRFLDEAISELQLTGIETIHARAEDLGRQKGYRESFDLVVSRAVANLSSLSEYCLPFVRSGGCFVSYKSADIDTELNSAETAIRVLGGGKTQVITAPLPCTTMIRSFVIVEKEKPTPAKYPRKAGTPSRAPLH